MAFKTLKTLAAATACCAISTSAHAGSATIDSIGGASFLNSAPLASLIFDTSSPVWTHADLKDVHDTLNAGGIVTESWITVLLADTDEGLALLTLVDDFNGGPFVAFDSSIAFQTTLAPGSNDVEFINDSGQDILGDLDNSPAAVTYGGVFTWESDNYADAFAFTQLYAGQSITGTFTERQDTPSAISANGIQFVTYNNGSYSVVANQAFEGDPAALTSAAYKITINIVPTPVAAGAALPMLALLGGTSIFRRRRNG